MAHRRDLYVLPPQGPGLPSLIRADAFRQIAEELEDFLLPEQARKELGIGRKVMDQLEAEGLIRRLPVDELVMETKPFRHSEIQRFVQACTASSTNLTKAEGRKLSTLVSATAPGRSVSDICRALLDGRLHSAGCVPDAKGLLQARLKLSDVERVLPSSKETLSLLDAAKQIGLHYEDVVYWAKRGLLETVRSAGAEERGLRLTRETWEEFLAEYATSKMLAQELGQKSNTWVSRHLRFLGVEPVSGEGVDGGSAMLFRRADVGPTVLDEIRRIQQGPLGSPQDRHRKSFARVKAVAAMIEADWSAVFTRSHNMFTDTTSGTALQVITGRRPDMTGVFLFHLWSSTLETLRKHPNPWIALVPNDGDHFLLVPADKVPFRGGDGAHLDTRYVSLRFDGRGRAVDLAQWERELPTADQVRLGKSGEKKLPGGGQRRRSFDRVVSVSKEIERFWDTELEGNRNAFSCLQSTRKLHIVCGRSASGTALQNFSIRIESFDRLAEPDSWVALVPEGGSAFVLAPTATLNWRGRGVLRNVSVRFDARGLPMDHPENSAVLPMAGEGGHV